MEVIEIHKKLFNYPYKAEWKQRGNDDSGYTDMVKESLSKHIESGFMCCSIKKFGNTYISEATFLEDDMVDCKFYINDELKKEENFHIDSIKVSFFWYMFKHVKNVKPYSGIGYGVWDYPEPEMGLESSLGKTSSKTFTGDEIWEKIKEEYK